MNPRTAIFLASFLLTVPVVAHGMDVQYGVVTHVNATKTPVSSGTTTGAAAGGLLGGLLGATSSRNTTSGDKRRRSLLYGVGGALAGAAVGSAVSGNDVTVYDYSVRLLDGSTVNITTEQGRIDKGDCVSIERGQSANIRRVAQVFCDVPEQSVYPKHQLEAKECSAAKQELVEAQGSEAIDAAIRKVKILCDD